jgi:RNA polymerase sigma-70 factor (ECF subfamily)
MEKPRGDVMLATERAARVKDDLDALLSRVAAGDRGAFRTAYDATAPRLFAICLRLTRNRPLAEDVLQEAFARVWERAAQFDPARGHAWSWMVAIARNHAIDCIRGTRTFPEIDPEHADPLAAAIMETQAEMVGVLRRLDGLEDGPRRAILLAYRDGLGYEELAHVMGIPVGTAKTWVSRGLARIRRDMDTDA